MELEVVDNLDSTDPDSALSANQGHILRDMINNLITGSLDEDGNIVLMFNANVFQGISL